MNVRHLIESDEEEWLDGYIEKFEPLQYFLNTKNYDPDGSARWLYSVYTGLRGDWVGNVYFLPNTGQYFWGFVNHTHLAMPEALIDSSYRSMKALIKAALPYLRMPESLGESTKKFITALNGMGKSTVSLCNNADTLETCYTWLMPDGVTITGTIAAADANAFHLDRLEVPPHLRRQGLATQWLVTLGRVADATHTAITGTALPDEGSGSDFHNKWVQTMRGAGFTTDLELLSHLQGEPVENIEDREDRDELIRHPRQIKENDDLDDPEAIVNQMIDDTPWTTSSALAGYGFTSYSLGKDCAAKEWPLGSPLRVALQVGDNPPSVFTKVTLFALIEAYVDEINTFLIWEIEGNIRTFIHQFQFDGHDYQTAIRKVLSLLPVMDKLGEAAAQLHAANIGEYKSQFLALPEFNAAQDACNSINNPA